jgi:hypothetical protein
MRTGLRASQWDDRVTVGLDANLVRRSEPLTCRDLVSKCCKSTGERDVPRDPSIASRRAEGHHGGRNQRNVVRIPE